MENGAVR